MQSDGHIYASDNPVVEDEVRLQVALQDMRDMASISLVKLLFPEATRHRRRKLAREIDRARYSHYANNNGGLEDDADSEE